VLNILLKLLNIAYENNFMNVQVYKHLKICCIDEMAK